MPGEDGLPSYEEVMGFERVFPQNISKQLNRQISETNQNVATGSSSNKCWIGVAGLIFFIVVPIVGVFMIIVGSGNLYACEGTMLPKWLLVGGSSVVFFYVMFALFCIGFCTRDATDRFATNSGLQTFSTSLMTLDLLFGVVWYGLGCYWSWSAKFATFSDSKKEREEFLTNLEHSDTDDEAEDDVKDGKCDVSVYWLALAVTILPTILAVFILIYFCASRRKTEEAASE